MTRKNYNELAADLKNLRENHGLDSDTADVYLSGADDAINIVIETLQRDNSHFDKTRFLNAIGR